MKRGNIYIAELMPRSGSEQTGIRPVVILSHNALNKIDTWRSIIVVPVTTSSSQAGKGLTVIFIPHGTGGLDRDSYVLCHQITTIDKSKLTKYIGDLPENIITQIERGVKIAIDLI